MNRHLGIGRGLATAYLSRPNHVVIGSVRDHSTPEVVALKSTQPANGSKLLLVKIESTSLTDPATALDDIRNAGIEYIDVVIANAATGGKEPFATTDTATMEDMATVYQTNTIGPFLLYQTFKPLLQKSTRSPKWISVTSAGGSIGMMKAIRSQISVGPQYCASKAALNWLTV